MSEISKKLWKHNTTSCHACFRPSMKKFQLFISTIQKHEISAKTICQLIMSLYHMEQCRIYGDFPAITAAAEKPGAPTDLRIDELMNCKWARSSACRRDANNGAATEHCCATNHYRRDSINTRFGTTDKIGHLKNICSRQIQIKCGKSLVGGSNSEQTHIDWVKWKMKMFQFLSF